jgi:hypothetical protein
MVVRLPWNFEATAFARFGGSDRTRQSTWTMSAMPTEPVYVGHKYVRTHLCVLNSSETEERSFW